MKGLPVSILFLRGGGFFVNDLKDEMMPFPVNDSNRIPTKWPISDLGVFRIDANVQPNLISKLTLRTHSDFKPIIC